MPLLFWLLETILNSLWQVPLIFAAAWLAARLARPAGPRMEHRVWVFALIAEIALPALHLNLASLWHQVWAALVQAWGLGQNPNAGEVRVAIAPGSVADSGLHLPSALLLAVGIIYAGAFVYSAVRLALGLWHTSRMQRQAQTLPADLAANFAHIQSNSTIHIAISPLVASPVTMGILRRVLLLPPGFLGRVTDADLDAVLAHELAHIERRDFAKNLLYGIISLPIAYHPAFWLTAARIAETREMVCDEAAASSVAGRDTYARALLRLASMLIEPMPAKTLHAIGIFDANIFERRIMNLTQKPIQLSTTRRIAIAGTCIVVALAACTSALALRMDVSPAVAQSEAPKKLKVKIGALKIVSQVQPVYPAEAKKARIEGSVILDVSINKEGVPTNIGVQSGPAELQRSAIDAVRQWRWEPYLLNGEPTDVETTITVVYSLGK